MTLFFLRTSSDDGDIFLFDDEVSGCVFDFLISCLPQSFDVTAERLVVFHLFAKFGSGLRFCGVFCLLLVCNELANVR